MPNAAALPALALLAGCVSGAGRSNTALTPETHDPHFPIASGAHAGTGCDSCHGPFDTFRQFTCTGCHLQPATDASHAGVASYRWDDASCYACHPRGDVSAAGHDVFFPINGSVPHQGIGCATCHTQPGNRKVAQCTVCHSHDGPTARPQHAAVADYAWQDAGCLRCHADAQVDKVASHAVGIAPGQVHASAGCLKCHPATRQDKPWGADFKTFDCLSCHLRPATDSAHSGVGGYAYDNASCLRCHPRGDLSGSIDHSAFFPIATGDRHVGLACGTCHVQPGNRKVVDCSNCHTHDQATAAPQHSLVGGYAWVGSTCVRCHAESQVARVSSHSPFQIGGGPHFLSACLTCHPSSRTDKTWAADFSTFDCLSCHDKARMDSVHAGEGGYAYVSTTCVGCHPAGRND